MNAVIPMRELNDVELDFVSGGNALDTTTGSYISYDKPAEEPGLGLVPTFGFIGGIASVSVRSIARLLIK